MKYSYRDPATGRFCKQPKDSEDPKNEQPKDSEDPKIYVYEIDLKRLASGLHKAMRFLKSCYVNSNY